MLILFCQSKQLVELLHSIWPPRVKWETQGRGKHKRNTGTGTSFVTCDISCFYQSQSISPTGAVKPVPDDSLACLGIA